MIRKQRTNRVLMVRPARFGYNAETAANNYFQKADANATATAEEACAEFDRYVELLRANGVYVLVIQDTSYPATPDSIFPNNWFSTHIMGELVLYPMYAENRRQERKPSALSTVGELDGITKVINLSGFEKEGLYLEGTGSMVLDRVNRIVYCCASERSSPDVLNEYCSELDYTYVFFTAADRDKRPIYHTNVMMCVAEKYAVICLESIQEDAMRTNVINSLSNTGHEIIPITLEQVMHFAGNMLEVESNTGESLLLMSAEAKRSLNGKQIREIERFSRILAPELKTIETNGGGSARCMVAELFLPASLSEDKISNN